MKYRSYSGITLMLTKYWLNHSQKIITKCDGIIINCDSSVYYKVRWAVITNCDSFLITKCDTIFYKLRQVLQIATERPSQHINHVRFLTGESTVNVKWRRLAFENKAKDTDTSREHAQNRRPAPYNRRGNGTTPILAT